MKLAIGVLLSLWLLAGIGGAWMQDDLDAKHWKTIAWGPFTLVEAWNDSPVGIPSP